MSNILLELNSVSLTFPESAQKTLEDIDFKLFEREIVAIIGKSGCGKSTLLRMICGLILPNQGSIKYFSNGKEVERLKTTMVFQSFALFPWMTVEENIALGLNAQNIEAQKVEKLTHDVIELMGLSGYESAYPREISGGMKQRVGLARALVVAPEVMVMDEPFSALDVFTANTLKNDLMDLWIEKKIPLKSMLIVTHSIEEAVMLADRVVVLSAKPGRIIADEKINIAHPRNNQSIDFKNVVDKIYSLLSTTSSGLQSHAKEGLQDAGLYYKVPFFSANILYGLMELISLNRGQINLSDIESKYRFETTNIFKMIDFLTLLKFIETRENDIYLTAAGKIVVEADIQARKEIFAEHLMQYLPIIPYIHSVLKDRKDNAAPKERFLALLEDHMLPQEANNVLKAVINWGRYAELFFYNDNDGLFQLLNS